LEEKRVIGSNASVSPAKKELSPTSEVALEFFTVAKAEITARIRVRDTLLAAYAAGAFTAIATILASPLLGPHYLYGVPYLALAFTLLVSYHHAGIGALGNYCATDLLSKLSLESRVLGFEHSHVYHQYHKKNSSRRVWAHAMILLFPAALVLLINWDDLTPAKYAQQPHFAAIWAASLVIMLVAFAVIYRSNRPHYQGLIFKGGFPPTEAFNALDDGSDV
jgi:hypothetical protein